MPILTGSLRFAYSLSRVAPAEVVEVPVSVRRQDQVPDWQGEEVDQHPHDVGEAVGCDYDQDAGEAEDQGQEDERDGWGGGVGYCCFYAEGACDVLASAPEVSGE